MIDVRKTEVFEAWFQSLRDRAAKITIARRLQRIEMGNFGDHRSVGGSVSELRIFVGPGYRVYFTRKGDQVVILLCGGDKSSQDKDIAAAKEMVASL